MTYFCRNHPNTTTEYLCAGCGQPFCDACTVDILGQRYCGPCRDLKVRQMQNVSSGATGGEAVFAGTGTVDIGRWLNAGWEIVRADMGSFIVAMLLGIVLAVLTCGILGGVVSCGLMMMSFRKMIYGRVEVGNLFDGFRRALWAILGAILFGVIGGIVGAPFQIIQYVAMYTGDRGLSALAGLINWPYSIIVGPLVGGILFFAMPHIAARNANPIDAIAASWQVFRRNPLMFWVTVFVLQLVSLAGAIACGIGVLFTIPIALAAQAAAYRDHFGIAGFDQADAAGYTPTAPIAAGYAPTAPTPYAPPTPPGAGPYAPPAPPSAPAPPPPPPFAPPAAAEPPAAAVPPSAPPAPPAPPAAPVAAAPEAPPVPPAAAPAEETAAASELPPAPAAPECAAAAEESPTPKESERPTD